MALAWVGLGSNLANELGDPRQLLCTAVVGLRQLGAVSVSSLYASAPMGPQDQPDYLNAVVCVDTTLNAFELLAYLQSLEQRAGRQRLRRWGERSLDLDILMMQEIKIQTPDLVIPHVGLMQRAFVVQPLLELKPDCQINGQYLCDLAVAQPSADLRIVEGTAWADLQILG